jgi:hypothetical protein
LLDGDVRVRKRRRLTLPVAALMLMLAGVARAQTSPEPPPEAEAAATEGESQWLERARMAPEAPEIVAPKTQAQALLTEGNKLVAAGDFGAALDRFRGAYELYPSAKLLLNIGTVLRHLGRNAEAASMYEAYMRDPGADPKQVEALRGPMRDIDRSTGKLWVRVNRRDAELRVDDKMVGRGPEQVVRVDPGEHTVVAISNGSSAVSTVGIRARQIRMVEVVLPEPPAPPPPVGETMRTVGHVALGTAIVSAVSGTVLLGLYLDADNKTESDEDFASAQERLGPLGIGAGIAFGVALASGVASVALLTSAPEEPKTEVRGERDDDEPPARINAKLVAGAALLGLGAVSGAVTIWAAVELERVKNDPLWTDFKENIAASRDACLAAENRENTDTGKMFSDGEYAEVAARCDEGTRLELVQAVMAPVSAAMGIGGAVLLAYGIAEMRNEPARVRVSVHGGPGSASFTLSGRF